MDAQSIELLKALQPKQEPVTTPTPIDLVQEKKKEVINKKQFLEEWFLTDPSRLDLSNAVIVSSLEVPMTPQYVGKLKKELKERLSVS